MPGGTTANESVSYINNDLLTELNKANGSVGIMDPGICSPSIYITSLSYVENCAQVLPKNGAMIIMLAIHLRYALAMPLQQQRTVLLGTQQILLSAGTNRMGVSLCPKGTDMRNQITIRCKQVKKEVCAMMSIALCHLHFARMCTSARVPNNVC